MGGGGGQGGEWSCMNAEREGNRQHPNNSSQSYPCDFCSSLVVLCYRHAGMIGVLITSEALMICLIRGTPRVTFMEAILEKG